MEARRADPQMRFLQAAVEAGLLDAQEARALAIESVRARRPIWEVAVETGRISGRDAERIRREVEGVVQPAGADSDAGTICELGPDSTGTLLDFVSSAEGGTIFDTPVPSRTPAPVPASSRPSAPPARAGRPSSAPASPGQAYEVLGELGQGGMGLVLRVRDPRIGREVAKKVVRQDRSRPGVASRFLREARITGQLEHPNIVPVYEVGSESDGSRYFTMKMVRGASLADVLARRGEGDEPSLSALLRIFLKICEAVAYAHSRGVVHRDLKPDNVMTGDFGEVLVMDWGLARADGGDAHESAEPLDPSGDEDDARLTKAGATLGTPAYMSPEQAMGDREVDERSDVFSLGAILYEILTGRPPFQSLTLRETMRRLLTSPAVPPRQAAPARRIPRELDAIALAALAKDPADRYGRVEDLSADVARYLEGLPVSVLPEGLPRRALKWAGRHPGVSAAAVASLLVTIAGGVVVGAILLDRERERFEASEARTRLAEEKALAESERARAASDRARATVPYLKVSGLLERNLSQDEIRAHVVPSLEEALGVDPTFVEARLALGTAWGLAGEFERAREAFLAADAECRRAFERTGEGVPGSPRALHALGQIAERIRIDGRAQEDPAAYYRRASELDPEDPYARISRLYVEAGPRGLAEAIELLEEFPHLAEVYSAYTYVLVQSRGPEGIRGLPEAERARAERFLGRAIELYQPGIVERIRLGEYHWMRANVRIYLPGGRDGAFSDYGQAEILMDRHLPPSHAAMLQRHFGESCLMAGREEEGLARLAQAARIDPVQARPLLLAGHYLLARKRPAESLPLLVDAAARVPAEAPDERESADFPLVVAAAEVGRFDLAAEALERLPEPWRARSEALSWEFPDWGERAIAALAALAVDLRKTGARPELGRRLAQFLAILCDGSSRMAKERFQERQFGEAASSATYAILAFGGLEERPIPVHLNLLGLRSTAWFNLGRYAEAAEDLVESLRINPGLDPTLRQKKAFDAYNLAVCRAFLGTADGVLSAEGRRSVLESLSQAAELGFARADVVERQTILAPLRDDPEYRAILARMGR